MAGEFLRVTDGNAAGAEIPLDDELLIGRSASGEGSLGDDSELSREHARITRSGDADLMIEDLASTNGTLVNDREITEPTAIRAGDTISVGNTTLEVVAAAQPTVARETVEPPVAPTRVAPQQAPAVPPREPGAPAPPPAPGGPPPGVSGPPPGVEGPPPGGPPPGVEGPPPGVGGGPPAGAGGPPAGAAGPQAMMAKMRKRMILTGLGGFLAGFGVAAAVFNLL